MGILHAAAFFGASSGGGGGGGAQLTSAYYSEIRPSAGSALCGLRFSRNGGLTNLLGLGNVALTNWWLPTTATIGDGYEVKCTLSSGLFSTGVSGTWYTISADRDFTVSVSASNQYRQATFNCDIRRISDSTVVASATFTIEADTLP